MKCSNCGADLYKNHTLEDLSIPPMTNKSKIISPKCSICGQVILPNIAMQPIYKKVLLITGTAGVGKTALGQFIESKSDYIFVDGDATQKKINFISRQNPDYIVDYQREVINTTLALLSLGYNVVVGYIINDDVLEQYKSKLLKYSIAPTFRVLVPNREVCLKRDLMRECWTAGEKWVDMWFEEMQNYKRTLPDFCIDNSNETLEETYNNHFAKLL